LRVLMAQGSVRELDFGVGVSHYEIAKEAHYHFICRACGHVEDAEMPVNNRLTAMVQRSARSVSFRVEDHRLDFIGVCQACQRAERRTNNQATH
jgi:Fe2+ or Zn2+ uptake regulation protein